VDAGEQAARFQGFRLVAKALSEKDLTAILSQQIGQAKHDRKTGGRDASREKAIDYFFGNMDAYVPPEANRSKVVSRDVADTINWMMPQIMRVFTASGRMFVAEPDGENDVDYADDASDALNYVFWKENKGYELVYAGSWDALAHGDAIVKTFYDDTPIYTTARFYENLTDDERAMLAGDDGTEVLAQTENTSEVPHPDDPNKTVEQKSYDLKVRHKKANGRYVISVIPPEDFLVSANAASLEDAGFKDHWDRTKTRSDLVAMGYDKDKVWTIPAASKTETPEQQARNLFAATDDATDKSMETIDYHECFMLIDVDGDGVAEMIRVCAAGPSGEVLLDWEVWEDEDPFDNIPCEPVPHRWDSRSVSDETIDIQDVKTVLWRQLLNNTYWSNNPQRFAKGKIHNPEQLDNPTFGGTVFGDANAEIGDLSIPYIGDKALMGMNYADQVRSQRTGVNSQSMALDPEVLQNQSATANQNAENASRSQPEMIARNMAEFGWSKVGRKLLRLMNAHEDGPRTILVKGKPVEIDPKSWNPDMHVTINAGLGTGSRDRDAAMLGQVLQQQILYTDRIGAVFPEKALDMLPFIHTTLTRFAESTGLHNPELYWPEIDPQEIAAGKQVLAQRAGQPDPKMQIEQIKAQAAIQVQQSEQQSNQIKAQAEVQKSQADGQVKMLEAQLAAQQQQADAELAQAQLQIKQLEIAAKNDTERWKAQLAADTTLKAQEIAAGNDAAAQILEANLDAELAAQAHGHAMERQAAAPKPEPSQPAQ
jgi:hypothetical protein